MTIILEGSFLRASFEEPPGSDSAGQNVRQPGFEANDYEAFERAFALENEAYTAGNIHVICQEPWLMKQQMSQGVDERSIQKAGKKLDGEHVDEMKWVREMLCCIRTAYMLLFQSLVKFHHKQSWTQHISQKPQKMVHQQTLVNCFSRAE